MFTFERTVAYSETDKMGITHHSNYVKFMEDTRVAFLKDINFPFEVMEAKGIVSPVISVSVEYKKTTTFADVLLITPVITKYTGVKLELDYEIRNKATGELTNIGHSAHAFMTEDGKIVSLKKAFPEMDAALRAACAN